MDGRTQSLVSYRLRTVRVGVQATLLVLAALLAFLLVPSSVDFSSEIAYLFTLVVAAAGAAIVSVLPWERLFAGSLGMLALYVWSVVDIILISVLIALTGGDESALFLLFGLTTVFFSASYPPRAQILLLMFTLIAYTVALLLVEEHVVLAILLVRFVILSALTFITSFLARELMAQNSTLQAEIARHTATEEALRESEAALAEAQELAELGSWTWDVRANQIVWSDQLFRIFGVDPEGFPADYKMFMNYVHEEDRAALGGEIQRALDDNSSFSIEHRLVRPDGEVRCVQASGRVESVAGEPLKMVGTALDITKRKKNEDIERRVLELQVRQRQAVEINDTVVQGLAVASYALDADDRPRAKAAVKKTLSAARSIVNELLNVDDLKPGDLVRSKSASVIAEDETAEPD